MFVVFFSLFFVFFFVFSLFSRCFLSLVFSRFAFFPVFSLFFPYFVFASFPLNEKTRRKKKKETTMLWCFVKLFFLDLEAVKQSLRAIVDTTNVELLGK